MRVQQEGTAFTAGSREVDFSIQIEPVTAHLHEPRVAGGSSGGADQGSAVNVGKAQRSVAVHVGQNEHFPALTVYSDSGGAGHGVGGQNGHIGRIQQYRTGVHTVGTVHRDGARLHQGTAGTHHAHRPVGLLDEAVGPQSLIDAQGIG